MTRISTLLLLGALTLGQGLLPDAIAPRWYAVGCAIFDIYIGAVAYLPILRR